MIAQILITILSLFSTILLIQIVMSLLYSFNVMPTHNQIVNNIYGALTMITAPILEPFRRLIPAVNGLDFSPIVVFILLDIAKYLVAKYLYF